MKPAILPEIGWAAKVPINKWFTILNCFSGSKDQVWDRLVNAENEATAKMGGKPKSRKTIQKKYRKRGVKIVRVRIEETGE